MAQYGNKWQKGVNTHKMKHGAEDGAIALMDRDKALGPEIRWLENKLYKFRKFNEKGRKPTKKDADEFAAAIKNIAPKAFAHGIVNAFYDGDTQGMMGIVREWRLLESKEAPQKHEHEVKGGINVYLPERTAAK